MSVANVAIFGDEVIFLFKKSKDLDNGLVAVNGSFIPEISIVVDF
jgi:hypothetical protein